MTRRIPAKLMLAQLHQTVGNEEDLLVLHRGHQGVFCQTNMKADDAMKLLEQYGFTLSQMPRKEKHDA